MTARLFPWIVGAASVLVCGFLLATEQGPKNAAPFAQFEIVDLTHALKDGIPVYPGGEPFKIAKVADFPQSGYYMNKISMGEHCGTHVDAPIHFIKGAKSIDNLPLDRLIGPLVVIDVQKEAATNPDCAVTVDDIRRWEKAHDQIPQGAFVVAHTGWWKKWGDPKSYINLGPDNQPHFPGFSADAARVLVVERKAAGLGVDTLSIDPGISKDFQAHLIVLKAGAINIENVANLGKIPARGATLVVAPLRITDGSGAPARVFALVPKQ
jgi:kynurenine formamidase